MKRLVFLFLILLAACGGKDSASVPEGLEQVTLRSGDEELVLFVEVADDYAERAQGLMHRTDLLSDRGMLFVFDTEQRLTFWMKNTLIPLDIIFFDTEGKFVSVRTMQPCTEDPCQRYHSGGEALYALEVNGGLAIAHGVGEGVDYRAQ